MNYEHKTFEGKASVVSVKVREQALGGNDALIFATKLDELRQDKFKHIIVDLSNVKLMNSSGLGMLVGGLSTLKKYDITMSLAAVPDKVNELLKMTHLDEVFKIYDTVENAATR
ncbi:MAG: STAS domain-containing protein [Candidatus Kapabacteria bacterium]|jgi:anti-sigma B factor antagonist|nr:STAS domain-containing protein [Candidatus Kapabacteria bacterium]